MYLLLNINDKNKKKGGTSMKLKISLRTYGINQGMIFYFKTTPGQNTIKTMLQKYCSFLIEQSKLKTIKENLYVHSFTMQWHNNSRGLFIQ